MASLARGRHKFNNTCVNLFYIVALCGLAGGANVDPAIKARINKNMIDVCGMNKHCMSILTMDGEYCCLRAMMPNFETATDGFWPQECAVVHDYLFDFDFQFQKKRVDHLKQLPYICVAWKEPNL